MYALGAADLLDVADSCWHDEVSELRMLTMLSALGGHGQVQPSTRELIEGVRQEERLRSALTADAPEAVEASAAAEAMFGGPAR